MVKYERFKECIIIGLSAISIAIPCYIAVDRHQVYEAEVEAKTKIQKEYSEYKKSMEKELENRDNTLDEYRRKLDEQDAKIESLEKKNSELKTQAQKAKEYPTQGISRSSNNRSKGTPVQITMTFYGDGAAENGGYAGIDAYGNKLVAGTVASNVYPRGTQFMLNGQVFTVSDRGGKNFNSYNRLDVFVPRKKGESDAAYARRISNYGKKTVTMYKL